MNNAIIQLVVSSVCSYFHTNFDIIVNYNSKDRYPGKLQPRQVIEYLLAKYSTLKDRDIAKITGVSRCTVMHSAKTIQDEIDTKSKLGNDVNNIIGIIEPKLVNEAMTNTSKIASIKNMLDGYVKDINTNIALINKLHEIIREEYIKINEKKNNLKEIEIGIIKTTAQIERLLTKLNTPQKIKVENFFYDQ